tara:strand:- start:2560 stop:3435 length:876 start_codon:yes stop_codon:yes gene_type:complete
MHCRLRKSAQILALSTVIEEINWHELTYGQLVTVRSTLLSQGKSASTVNLTLSALRSVLKSAFQLGQLDSGKLARLCALPNMRSTRRSTGRALSSSEINNLLDACKKDQSRAGLRDELVLQLMLLGGLRRAEVVSLRRQDYDCQNGELSLIGKGNKQRIIYISGALKSAMHQWLNQMVSSDDRTEDKRQPLFTRLVSGSHGKDRSAAKALSTQAVYDIVRKRAEQAGLDPVRPHDLRRTFITRLMQQGVDLHTISKMAGHESVVTTCRYDKRDASAQQEAACMLALLIREA